MTRGFVLVLVLAMAGCGVTSDRIYNLNVYRASAQSTLFAGSTASKNVPVFISGNPFGIQQMTLANVIASSLQSAFPNRQVGFVVRDTEDVRSDVSMIVAFDPPPGTTGVLVCGAPNRLTSSPTSEAIRTVMAFCFGDRPLVSVEGKLDRSSGVGDADFVVLLRDMTRRMFEAGPSTP